MRLSKHRGFREDFFSFEDGGRKTPLRHSMERQGLNWVIKMGGYPGIGVSGEISFYLKIVDGKPRWDTYFYSVEDCGRKTPLRHLFLFG